MTLAQLDSRRVPHPEEETLQSMVDAALSYPSIKDVALAVMCTQNEAQKKHALESFAPQSKPDSFQKLLNLSALFVASGYYGSAYQTLQVAAALKLPSLISKTEDQLTTLAKRMLRGTKELDAKRMHGAINLLFRAELPISLQYQDNTGLLELPHGKIVNVLRSDQGKETLDKAKECAKQVVEELLKNKVFPWVIDFIDQSLKHGQATKTHGIFSKDIYQETVAELTRNLLDNKLQHACLWHLEHVTSLYAEHLLSVREA